MAAMDLAPNEISTSTPFIDVMLGADLSIFMVAAPHPPWTSNVEIAGSPTGTPHAASD